MAVIILPRALVKIIVRNRITGMPISNVMIRGVYLAAGFSFYFDYEFFNPDNTLPIESITGGATNLVSNNKGEIFIQIFGVSNAFHIIFDYYLLYNSNTIFIGKLESASWEKGGLNTLNQDRVQIVTLWVDPSTIINRDSARQERLVTFVDKNNTPIDFTQPGFSISATQDSQVPDLNVTIRCTSSAHVDPVSYDIYKGEILTLVAPNYRIPSLPILLWDVPSPIDRTLPVNSRSLQFILGDETDTDWPDFTTSVNFYCIDEHMNSVYNCEYTVSVFYNETEIVSKKEKVYDVCSVEVSVSTESFYDLFFYVKVHHPLYEDGVVSYNWHPLSVPSNQSIVLFCKSVITEDDFGGPGRAELSHVIRPIYALPTDIKKSEITQTGIGNVVSNVLDPEDPPEGWGRNVLFRAGLFKAGTLFNEKGTTDQKLTKWVRDIYPIPNWVTTFVTSYWMGVIDQSGNLWVRGKLFERNTGSNEYSISDKEFSEIFLSSRIGKFAKLSINNYNIPAYVVGNLYYICHLLQDEPNKQMHVRAFGLRFDPGTNLHLISDEDIVIDNDNNVPLIFVAGGPKGSAFFYINQSGHLMGRSRMNDDEYLMGTNDPTFDFVRINPAVTYKTYDQSIDATENTVVAIRSDRKIDAIGLIGLNNVSSWTTLNTIPRPDSGISEVMFDYVRAGITTSLYDSNNKYGVIVGYDINSGYYVYDHNVNAMVYTDKWWSNYAALGNGFVLSRDDYNMGHKAVYNPFGNEGLPNYLNVIANTMPDLHYAWGGSSNGMGYVDAVHTDSINSAAYIKLDDVILP